MANIAQRARIAIDVDGGDHGAVVTLPAAARFLERRPDAELLLVGTDASLAQVDKFLAPALRRRVSTTLATEVVGMDESPALSLKNKKNSTLRLALNAVKEGDADACVSAGNTGALMATARFVLKTLPGIDRPAIAFVMPAFDATSASEGQQRRGTIMLDLGANVDCTAEHLRQFAVMGSALASALTDNPRPSVALLNIGEEDIKGNEQVKAAADLLRATDLNFVGNIEGNDVYRGKVDVIVCDGFVGNVALKISEGMASAITQIIRDEFSRDLRSRLIAAIAMPVLKRFKARLDPSEHNGATLLGLRGIVVKSHGGADVAGFTSAIERAYQEIRHDLIAGLTERVAHLGASASAS
ncbi:MAG: phosphate acyltransferase PlsX [Burkholderiales bacterium]|nr:phosphate acyltransferase PlsX [Burkholderiales bacterium]